MRYLLYSLHGEPLEFTTEAGDAWEGINRFTVTDAKGAVIAKGQSKNKNHAALYRRARPRPLHAGLR